MSAVTNATPKFFVPSLKKKGWANSMSSPLTGRKLLPHMTQNEPGRSAHTEEQSRNPTADSGIVPRVTLTWFSTISQRATGQNDKQNGSEALRKIIRECLFYSRIIFLVTPDPIQRESLRSNIEQSQTNRVDQRTPRNNPGIQLQDSGIVFQAWRPAA